MIWTAPLRPLAHPYAGLFSRAALSGIFLYAGLSKIGRPADFAEVVASYRLAPYWMVPFAGVYLPWLEVVCALMVLVGLRSKAAAWTLLGLLVVFTVGILLNLLRGDAVGCGCFSASNEPATWWTFARDLGFIALALHVLRFDSRFKLENLFRPKVEDAA